MLNALNPIQFHPEKDSTKKSYLAIDFEGNDRLKEVLRVY